MAARPRRTNESFRAYRKALKSEEAAWRSRARGRMIHVSEIFHWNLLTGRFPPQPGVTYRRKE